MGKSTISMAIFNSFLYVYRRVKRINHVPLASFKSVTTSLPPHFLMVVQKGNDPHNSLNSGEWNIILHPHIYIYSIHTKCTVPDESLSL